MARAIDADELEMFPYSEESGTEEQIAEWIEQAGLSEEDTADRARLLCWKVIEGCINVVKTQPTLTPPNEWVSVEDRLPEAGERVLAANGSFVGEAYLASNGAWMRHDGFPWEVDAWMPLPAPPDRRPVEGEKAEHKAKCAKCGQEKEIACTVNGEPWCEDCFDRAMG